MPQEKIKDLLFSRELYLSVRDQQELLDLIEAAESSDRPRPSVVLPRREGEEKWYLVEDDADTVYKEFPALARKQKDLRIWSFDLAIVSELNWKIGKDAFSLPASPEQRKALDLFHSGREAVSHDYWQCVAKPYLQRADGPTILVGARTAGEKAMLEKRADLVFASTKELGQYLRRQNGKKSRTRKS